MQPTYLYTSELDKEIQWRSKFSIVIPILIGFLQMILTFAIVGLEIASVVITPVKGTLYAGFWLSTIFTLSWVAMLTLVCCHRSRRCALYVFFISLLCAGAAIALIVLDAFFIGNIDRCYFANAICRDLEQSYNRPSSAPLGRKVQVLKGQIACAALLLATALLYMLLFILASIGSRTRNNRVVIENSQLPPQVNRQYGRQPSPAPVWKSTSVPVTYEPSQLECPHCGTLIKLAQKKR
ncbi:unnamed protein product [Rotaria magnacalcarata]|uniref:Uncharacterized protein n=1 Tax=Rotaria magnacalcarata TaxID=392030 RepID=A0A816NIM6_9BILA|nr:unnamed protein product [Rotaria magnacalcarata]CAF1658920.1 unnamed protein product [Rotaria magnacalcarata]CAF2033266.1 unnamed protein product [Rotaria magnacalcarata]CAF2104399.1 unnamed protein product [Rotaria magnacalcarata]CAF2138301.1 unnamed protein product [Rotaria magnacalcarata]